MFTRRKILLLLLVLIGVNFLIAIFVIAHWQKQMATDTLPNRGNRGGNTKITFREKSVGSIPNSSVVQVTKSAMRQTIFPRTLYCMDNGGLRSCSSGSNNTTTQWQHHAAKPHQRQKRKKYKHKPKPDFYQLHPECKPMHDWQSKSYSTCNIVHEVDLTNFGREQVHRQVQYKSHGYFRDVLIVPDFDQQSKLVLKVLRLGHAFSPAHFDRHRRDAVAMERLTASPFIMDIYGYCGQSALFDYGKHGTIDNIVWGKKTFTFIQILEIATQLAEAVADLHSFFGDQPAIAHTDISPSQFVFMDGRFKLNDFNRCVFLYQDTTNNNITCPFIYPANDQWTYRAPEEYARKNQTEKIDVYAMGNVFFMMLERDWPFHESFRKGSKRIQKRIATGERPSFVHHKKLLKSKDSAVLALREAMNMCWVQDWRQRATAVEVRDYLVAALDTILKPTTHSVHEKKRGMRTNHSTKPKL